jgi:hypothetical protein
MKNSYKISVRKPEGKRSFRRSRWQDIIKIDPKGIQYEGEG